MDAPNRHYYEYYKYNDKGQIVAADEWDSDSGYNHWNPYVKLYSAASLYKILRAAQYFGMNFIYLENGSGADIPIDCNLIKFLSKNVDIPIIIGGGIKTKKDIVNIKSAGASFIVLGTVLEKNPNSEFIANLLS